MDALWFEFIGVLLLILLVGFFSAAEAAVLSARKSRMKELADDGDRHAAVIVGFQSDPERFLATIHVGVVFSLILASGLGGVIAIESLVPALAGSSVRWISEASTWLALATLAIVLGSLVVVFGQLVPKSLALRVAEPLALRMAPPLVFFAVLFKIPGIVLTFTSNLVLRPFNDRTTFAESRVSEEEFKLMLAEGTKTGVIDKTEEELIKSIFEFTDTTAKEVMIPRPDVVALNIDLPRETLFRIVLEEGYSRMPVYRETIDNIVGVIYSKDLLGLMEHSKVIILQDLIRPAFFIPESKRISHLMRELQVRKMHMAIVIDEFGGMEGIVTMEDILEEIVGEIHDEYDEELKDIEQTAEGTFMVNARLPVGDFNQRFSADLPDTGEFETIGGFLHKQAGRIPDLNEDIAFGQHLFTVMKKSQRRIRLVRVKRISPASPSV